MTHTTCYHLATYTTQQLWANVLVLLGSSDAKTDLTLSVQARDAHSPLRVATRSAHSSSEPPSQQLTRACALTVRVCACRHSSSFACTCG